LVPQFPTQGTNMNAAILAALAGLLGVAVGRLWDTHAETKRWRRDQRLRVYERLIGAYYELREALRVLAMCEPETAESEVAEIRVYEVAAAAWNEQVVAAWLHGSPPVISAVETLDRHVVSLFFRARSRKFTWHEFLEDRQSTQEAHERYIEAVRKESRQPSLKVTVSYPPPGLPLSQSAADAASNQTRAE